MLSLPAPSGVYGAAGWQQPSHWFLPCDGYAGWQWWSVPSAVPCDSALTLSAAEDGNAEKIVICWASSGRQCHSACQPLWLGRESTVSWLEQSHCALLWSACEKFEVMKSISPFDLRKIFFSDVVGISTLPGVSDTRVCHRYWKSAHWLFFVSFLSFFLPFLFFLIFLIPLNISDRDKGFHL